MNAPREFATPAPAAQLEEPPLPEEPPADLEEEPPFEETAPPAVDDGWDVVAIPGGGAPAVLEDEPVVDEVVVVAEVAAPAAPAAEKTPQQSKMAVCNKEAEGKKGDERKAFMSECLKK